jgi:hypothetical protein
MMKVKGRESARGQKRARGVMRLLPEPPCLPVLVIAHPFRLLRLHDPGVAGVDKVLAALAVAAGALGAVAACARERAVSELSGG